MIVYLDGVAADQVIDQNEAAGEASRFPEGTIPVALSGDTLGLYYPADRQAAMRWADSPPAELPLKYLATRIGYAENNDTQTVFANRAIASWRFDFGGDTKTLASVAKPLMLNLIDRMGLSLASMSDWETSVSGNSLFIKGELGVSDVRVLLSVLAQSPETLGRLKLSGDDQGSQNTSLTKADSTKMQSDMLKNVPLRRTLTERYQVEF